MNYEVVYSLYVRWNSINDEDIHAWLMVFVCFEVVISLQIYSGMFECFNVFIFIDNDLHQQLWDDLMKSKQEVVPWQISLIKLYCVAWKNDFVAIVKYHLELNITLMKKLLRPQSFEPKWCKFMTIVAMGLYHIIRTSDYIIQFVLRNQCNCYVTN